MSEDEKSIEFHRNEIRIARKNIASAQKAKQNVLWIAPLAVIVVSIIAGVFSGFLAFVAFVGGSFLAVVAIKSLTATCNEHIQGSEREISNRRHNLRELGVSE